jgi:phosphoribosylformylglycinamidine synthase
MSVEEIFAYKYGAFLLESDAEIEGATLVGSVTEAATLTLGGVSLAMSELDALYEGRLESVYPVAEAPAATLPTFDYKATERVAPAVKCARPRVLIPVFPGTNCEYDSAKVMADAGAEADIFVINNLTKDAIARSVEEFSSRIAASQMIFVPGGFSGGDEPDGSGKFIMAFFKNAAIREAVSDLLAEESERMIEERIEELVCRSFDLDGDKIAVTASVDVTERVCRSIL